MILLTIAYSTHSVVFECRFYFNRLLLDPEYACDATVVLTDNYWLEDARGTHFNGFSNADVKVLLVDNQRYLTRIPSGIDAFFPNIKLTRWADGDLRTFNADDLKQFPNLLRLMLQNNKIVSLDGDLFKHTPKLTLISFQENLIEHVGHDLLTGLRDLETADFRRNVCIDLNANSRQLFIELKHRLQIDCPPLECSAECSMEIELLEEKLSEKTAGLMSEMYQLQNSNAMHDKKIHELDEIVDGHAKSIKKLEEQIENFCVNSCPCS